MVMVAYIGMAVLGLSSTGTPETFGGWILRLLWETAYRECHVMLLTRWRTVWGRR